MDYEDSTKPDENDPKCDGFNPRLHDVSEIDLVKDELDYECDIYEDETVTQEDFSDPSSMEDTKNFNEEFIDEKGNVWNRDSYLLNSDGVSPRLHDVSEIDLVKDELDFKSDISKGETLTQEDFSDSSSMEDTKNFNEEFIDEKGNVWNRDSYLVSCIKKDAVQDILPEEMQSIQKVDLKSSHQKSCIDEVQGKTKHHKCHMCNYSTFNLSKLILHIAGVHYYKCNECDFHASTESSIKTHTDSVHKKVLHHKCHLCGFSALYSSRIKNHIAHVHHNEKSHNCPECNYSATKTHMIKKHITKAYKRIKLHKCHFCDYSSAKSTHLRRHIAQYALQRKAV